MIIRSQSRTQLVINEQWTSGPALWHGFIRQPKQSLKQEAFGSWSLGYLTQYGRTTIGEEQVRYLLDCFNSVEHGGFFCLLFGTKQRSGWQKLAFATRSCFPQTNTMYFRACPRSVDDGSWLDKGACICMRKWGSPRIQMMSCAARGAKPLQDQKLRNNWILIGQVMVALGSFGIKSQTQ
jgi:hypothetical protein